MGGTLPTCLLVEIVAEPYVPPESPGQVVCLLPYLTSSFYGGAAKSRTGCVPTPLPHICCLARHVLLPVQGKKTLPIRGDIVQVTPRPVRQRAT